MNNFKLNKRSLSQKKLPVISFKRLFRSSSALQYISLLTKSKPECIFRKARTLRWKIQKMIRNNGIKFVSALIKRSEKEYLLTGKTSWFSLRYVSGKGITANATKVFLSIHRNMVSDGEADLQSILHKAPGTKKFISKYRKVIREILKHKNLYIKRPPKKLIYKSRGIRRSFLSEEFSPYTNNIDVDLTKSNLDRPFQVLSKARASGPCITSQKGDMCAILKNGSHLLQSLERVYSHWKMPWKVHYEPCLNPCDHYHSRLISLKEKSCKIRVVAIFDYYSQVALRPLHSLLTRLIKRKFKNDYTFNQFKGVDRLCRTSGYYHSVDLSSATDTIPVKFSLFLVEEIVKKVYPRQFVKDISTILTDRAFRFNSKLLRYQTGQPMGAYASFPLLSLTNHIIVNMAYYIGSGMNPKSLSSPTYSLVGDDVVIGRSPYVSSSKASKLYQELMDELGVPINRSKTISGFRTFEFCKRIIKNSRIQSFPSWNCLYLDAVSGNPYNSLSLLETWGYELPSYRALCGLRSRFLSTNPCKGVGKLLFSRSSVKNMIRVSGIKIPFYPKSCTIIPSKIVLLSRECIFLKESLKKKPKKYLGDDPFLQRLNYNRLLFQIYSKTLRKKCDSKFWKLPFSIKGQIFYLSYLKSYHSLKLLRKESYKNFLSRSKDLNDNRKIAHFAMSHKVIWPKWFMKAV